jgi:hypothetical protein
VSIQGVGSATSTAQTLSTPPTPDALKTLPQKLAEARAEANAGINAGDENSSTSSSTVNTLA